ncbi:TetR/AcrR family transcriptional regulator [Nocardia lijiangensis]|uniref:TetR/AcrR family transcriptional regulator n=1 Tax=Nocardia lijiangensis TaxID=299618 RepID=UPI003D72418D
MTDATRPRRIPSQTRSIERVRRIHAAALALIEEGGFDAATTTAIAERAQVSVATLYQFFANREAILEALIGGQIEILDRRMAEDMAAVRVDSVAAAVEVFLDTHNAHYLEHPQFVVLYYRSRYRSRGVNVDVQAHMDRMVDIIETVLVGGGLLPHSTDRRVLHVALELCDRIFEMAYRSNPTGDDAIINEGKIALTRYLEAHR